MKTSISRQFLSKKLVNTKSTVFLFLFGLMMTHSATTQDICSADTSFTDILFVIDNSGSIDDAEYDKFSDIIMATITNVQQKCRSSQIGVMHYGGAFGTESFIEYDFSRLNEINDVERQFCIIRNQFDNCSNGGGDDLNAAMGDVISNIQDGTLNRNELNKLVIVIFTDAFGFEASCNFINCSQIRPFTNIDILKGNFDAQVTVVGASSQAEASLLAIYASPGGSFDNVTLFAQDCPSTFDGCTLPRKYIPIEFDSPIGPSSDSITICVNCTVEIIDGVTADAGEDQTLCEEDDSTVTLTAQMFNGTPPFTFDWNQGLGTGNDKQVSPIVTTTYIVTITDSNGCIGSDQVTITVENCIPDCGAPPIINCPSDTIICPGADIAIDLMGTAIGLPGDPNCPDPEIISRDSVVTTDECHQTIYRIWTASYTNDNSMMGTSECIQVIQLVDDIAPLINGLPDDIDVDSDDNCIATVTWIEPIAEDNCAVGSFTSNVQSGSGTPFGLGTTFVVYIARDLCGNESIDSFAVNVIQQCCIDPPIISCPADYNGCPNGTTDPEMTGIATASPSSDLCAKPNVTFSDVIEDFGNCEGQVIIQRTWTATDPDHPDLEASCVQIISLLDTVPPEIVACPPDVTLDPDDPMHTWEDPMVIEGCGFSLSYNIPNGSIFTTGQTKVVATATDMCGNLDTCFFIVTVPEEVQIICPADTTLRCLDTLLITDIPKPEVSTTCALCEEDPDNCIQTTVRIDSVIPNGLMTIYVITYSATDLCGTDNECTFEIIVDQTAFIACPEDIIIIAPPYGFDYISWEKPVFQTCCTLCKVKQIDGFLYMGQLGDSYYYCSYARVKWKKAQHIATNNGGHLAVINSMEENDFLSRRLIEREAYIGLTDSEEEGRFEWVNGDNTPYRRWKRNQPDNDGNEDFVEMDAQGYWFDVDGNTKREFIMEIEGCDQVTQTEGPEPGSKFRVGTTRVTYVAEDGCGDSDSCSFDIVLLPFETEEEDHQEEAIAFETEQVYTEPISIRPNPATSFIYVNAKENIASIEIYRIDGQLVDVLSSADRLNDKIDISKYQTGLLWMKVITEDGEMKVIRVIVSQ